MAVRGRVDEAGGGAATGTASGSAATTTSLLDVLRRAQVRPEVRLGEAPAPQRLAPFAVAITGDVVVNGVELATGRLVVLHDPDGQEAWHGVTRMVAYAKAECDPEMVSDPLLPGVGWSWLVEALEARSAVGAAMSGTVTRVASESFGALADAGRPATADVELRASWTPVGDDLDHHVEAWADLLCTAAGLPPVPVGVATLRPRRPTR